MELDPLCFMFVSYHLSDFLAKNILVWKVAVVDQVHFALVLKSLLESLGDLIPDEARADNSDALLSVLGPFLNFLYVTSAS